ncbi:MAG: HD domain-containing phosphohydrolase [Pseudomonadota bacterium]
MDPQPYIPSDPSLIEVPVLSLQPGMYVAELDRPWLDSPFATQGFVVKDDEEIEFISQHCSHVYIDPRNTVRVNVLTEKRFKPRAARKRLDIRRDFARSKVDFESASEAMARVFDQIQVNRRLDITSVKKAINPLIDSVFRNPEAVAALTRMKDTHEYFFNHSLSVAVWSAVLGRHLGFEKSDLIDLATGAAVMDVGMSELGDNILQNTGVLSAAEVKEIQNHVRYSLERLNETGGVSKTVLNLVACHHERHDGSGYPMGLNGADIPLHARIAGLVDSYDAMTTQRPHAPARSSFEAMQELADMKDAAFQGSLVEHFIQTVGMFPTGCLVELNTGEVGVVVEQNVTRRLRPKVILVTDDQKQKRGDMTLLDLSQFAAVQDGTPTQWITRELQVGAYDINPVDYFL